MKRKTARLALKSITVANLVNVVGGVGDNTACTGNESGCVVKETKKFACTIG